MPSMTGKFLLIEGNNFREYLDAIGVVSLTGKMLGDVITGLPSPLCITKKQDEWTMKTCYTEIKFKLGQEFDETIADFCSCKSVITQKGENKLVHVQKFGDPKVTITIVREFTDTEMKITIKLPADEIAYLIFERQ